MKKVIYLSAIVLIGIFTFISCETETEIDTTSIENLKLSSPNGKILAINNNQLKDIIINNSDDNVLKEYIDISFVNYYENDFSSIAVVDYVSNSENKSLLVPLELKNNYHILIDKQDLYIIESTNTFNKSNYKKNEVLILDDNDNFKRTSYSSRTAYVCNGGCCGWTQTGSGQYNCGCDAAKVAINKKSDEMKRKLLLTTSDNCAIQVIAD